MNGTQLLAKGYYSKTTTYFWEGNNNAQRNFFSWKRNVILRRRWDCDEKRDSLVNLLFFSSREKLLLYFSFLSITFITKKALFLTHPSFFDLKEKRFRETEMSTLKKCLWILYTVFKNYKKVSFWNKLKKFFCL